MAVVTSITEERYRLRGNAHCKLCENRIVQVPFVVWWAKEELYFCARCCQHLMKSLAADLIQVDAIVRLQELGYSGLTLHRESQKEQTLREQRDAAEWSAEIWRAIDSKEPK